MSIEIANETDIDVPEQGLIDVAKFALGKMNVHPAAELSMILVDEEAMAELHMRWMDLPGPTDVMSFPMDELEPGGRPDSREPGPSMLGDIVLCPAFAEKQAAQAGHSLERELNLLTVHGVLHLLGYDHAEPDEEKEMFGLQNRILADWYEHLQDQDRRAKQEARDRKLLGKAGFLQEDPSS